MYKKRTSELPKPFKEASMNDGPKLELVVSNDEEIIPAKPGRQEPPGPSDWLSGLSSGTEFLCRDKAGRYYPRFVVLEYTHGGKIQGNVLLIPTKTMNDVKSWQWCDPLEFCNVFEFRGIIGEAE